MTDALSLCAYSSASPTAAQIPSLAWFFRLTVYRWTYFQVQLLLSLLHLLFKPIQRIAMLGIAFGHAPGMFSRSR